MNCTCTHPQLVQKPEGLWCAACRRPVKVSEPKAANGATMDAALIARRFAEFRRAYRALETCLRSQGIDLKSE
jgi:hypothetical protein